MAPVYAPSCSTAHIALLGRHAYISACTNKLEIAFLLPLLPTILVYDDCNDSDARYTPFVPRRCRCWLALLLLVLPCWPPPRPRPPPLWTCLMTARSGTLALTSSMRPVTWTCPRTSVMA